MLSQEDIHQLEELDRIVLLCASDEGTHILDELKKADFCNVLSDTQQSANGPVHELARVAMEAHSQSFSIVSELDDVRRAMAGIVSLMEQQIWNKGDTSPSEQSVLLGISTLRSMHMFL